MTRPSRLLSTLFGVALLGVLLAGGLLAWSVGGLPVLLGYAVVAGLLVGLGIARIRRLVAAGASSAPPVCACCDGDHSAPVRVL
jgi:hypothetical protein